MKRVERDAAARDTNKVVKYAIIAAAVIEAGAIVLVVWVMW